MPDAVRLNKAETVATPVAGGGVLAQSIDTDFHTMLTVQAQAAGAASGDWTVTVVPVQGDGATPQPATLSLPAIRSGAPTFAGGKVNAWSQYDVQGFDKVQVQFKNTTGGPLTVDRLTLGLE